MKRILTLLFLFFASSPTAWPQLHLNLRSQAFNEDNGLSKNVVNDFAQDQNGLMWIATANGLNRFDGKTFTVFKKNYADTNSIRYNIISRIAVDSKNNIWIGYASNGISCYDQITRTFTHFLPDSTRPHTIPSGVIDEILIDNQDRLWIGIAHKGLTLFDPSTKKFTWFGMLPFVSKERSVAGQRHYNRLTQFEMGREGKLWMATGDGFYSFDTTAKIFEVFRFESGKENIDKWKKDVFNTICRLNEDDFYLAGWGTGLNHYNRKTGQWKNYLIKPQSPERGTSNIINSITRKSEHELWVASNDTSLCVFNTRDERFHFISQHSLSEAQLTGEGVRVLFTDRSGDLWIGHLSGFNFLNQSDPEFTFIHHPVSYSENSENYGISYVYDDPVSGKSFISTTYADGLNVIDQQGRVTNHPVDLAPGEEPFQLVFRVYNDSRNKLWVLTRDFIYHFDREKNVLVKAAQPVPDTAFRGPAYYWNMLEGNDGLLWIATHRHGIYVFNPVSNSYSHIRHVPGLDQSLRSNIITGIGLDPSGKLWVGYKNHGVSSYDPSKRHFTHFNNDKNNPESLIDNDILALHADTSGTVWIGSFTGLSNIETGKTPLKINNFLKDQELLGIIVSDIETDLDGNVWFSNSKGLSMFNPRSKELKNYNHDNGLPNSYEGLFISKGSDKNELILTTFAGYYRFRPEFAKKIQKPGNVLITSFVTGDRSILYEKEMKDKGKILLRANDNLFTVEFISINYKYPASESYAYRLKGIDDAWKTTARSRIASYTHLPGGEYIFEVKVKNPAGIWSEITQIPVFIDTPFYKTNWFTITMAVLATTIIFTFYRFRIRSIEKTEALKTRFNKQLAETEMRALRAQMNPHFIFNCLNSINRYIVKNDHKTASLYLTKFAKLIRLILDNSENHQVTLSQELEALKLYIDIEALRFDHKFSYEISVDENINADSILIPPMIIQPFVENAIWHGLLHKESHGRMKLRFYLENDILVCEVEDDGVGREKAMELKSKSATTRKSLGLKITSERLAILNEKTRNQGGVYFEDLKDVQGIGSGTRVTIRVPVDAE